MNTPLPLDAAARPLRYVMLGNSARQANLLWAGDDGNDLHGEWVATIQPPFAGSGGGPTSEAWRGFVEAVVGAWNDSRAQSARVAELEANNEGSLKAATYWKEQHDRAAKRVAELEAELARAEVEAFMGEGWVCVLAFRPDGDDRFHVMAERDGLCLDAYGPTYCAAVDALKQAWRDAVRPWLRMAVGCYEIHREEHTPEEVVSRVLKEDSNG